MYINIIPLEQEFILMRCYKTSFYTFVISQYYSWLTYIMVIELQWNLSVTTTSIIKSITCDLFSGVL